MKKTINMIKKLLGMEKLIKGYYCVNHKGDDIITYWEGRSFITVKDRLRKNDVKIKNYIAQEHLSLMITP